MLSCIQAIEDGFDILDATDYGPYPNIDKVTSSFFTKRNHICHANANFAWIEQDLGEDAFLPLSPREVLETGQVCQYDPHKKNSLNL